MLEDGNFVVYIHFDSPSQLPIWNAGTGGRPLSAGPFYVAMQYDGNLVIYSARSGPIWESGSFHKGIERHRLVMLDDGNLVIYDGRGEPQWASYWG